MSTLAPSFVATPHTAGLSLPKVMLQQQQNYSGATAERRG